MDPHVVKMFGTQFPVDDVRDLELLTDLLVHSGEHLNVVFAVASHLEHVPNGYARFRPALRQRLGNSLQQLGVEHIEPLPGADTGVRERRSN